MATPRLAERARRRLVAILSDDRPEPSRWSARLQNWGVVEGQPAFSNAARLLFHLRLSESESEKLLQRVLDHREAMTRALGRDPGLRVAGVDYLSNIEGRLVNPKIVEMETFERTERSARTDAPTGLLNRRAFSELFDRELRRARRYRLPLALLMLDLDRFKRVNDEGGHLLGDVVLERFASLLRRTVREADLACRYGGEEFAVILPETDRTGAFAVGERVRTRAESGFAETPVGGRIVGMTVSGGVSCYPEDGTTRGDLVGRADAALYLAKARGRNRVVAFHSERRDAVRYPARGGTRLTLLDRADGRSIPARALNVSRGGALLETELPLDLDAAFEVVLEDGPSRVEGTPLGRGRVVRIETASDSGLPRRVGLAFSAPLPEDLLHGRLASNVSASGAVRGVRR